MFSMFQMDNSYGDKLGEDVLDFIKTMEKHVPTTT